MVVEYMNHVRILLMTTSSLPPFCKDCINARKKFRKGDRVVLSGEGCKTFPDKILQKSIGTVVGFSKEYNCARILIDGLKHPQTFHSGFWERIIK